MPELPEIETIKRGIKVICQQKIINTVVREPRLRYFMETDLPTKINGQTILSISRRSKYLILHLEKGFLIVHLGMSGSLTLTTSNDTLIKTHDHVDIVLTNHILRYNDPRRFGCIIYTTNNYQDLPIMANLGPEPLTDNFNPDYLLQKIAKRQASIKQLIMDNQIVVGVGNIYACESLFQAKISPLKAGKDISKKEANKLTRCIKDVLANAIKLGGSSLRDYKQADGTLGNFQNIHKVYGRANMPCIDCGSKITEKRLGQRNSFYCPICQK